MKQELKYAKVVKEGYSFVHNRIVILRNLYEGIKPKKGWLIVQLVDDKKEPYGFPFPLEKKFLEDFKFEEDVKKEG